MLSPASVIKKSTPFSAITKSSGGGGVPPPLLTTVNIAFAIAIIVPIYHNAMMSEQVVAVDCTFVTIIGT